MQRHTTNISVLIWCKHFNKVFDNNSKHYQHNYMYTTHMPSEIHMQSVDNASDNKYKSIEK